MAGVWVEEIDALAPEQTNSIRFSDGTVGTCRLLCDLMHLEGAEALAEYTSNFYAGMPTVTRNAFGKGAVYYVGANLDQASLDKVMSALLAESGTAPTVKEPTDLEVTVRETETEKITFLINFQPDTLPLPAEFAGKTDLLSGKLLETETALAPYDVILVAEPKEKQ